MSAMMSDDPNDYDRTFPHDGPRTYDKCKKCGVTLTLDNAHCQGWNCHACATCMPNTSRKRSA